jgi:lysophospholipase L1-like esterase
MKGLIVAFLAVGLAGCRGSPVDPPAPKPQRVVFIGDSITWCLSNQISFCPDGKSLPLPSSSWRGLNHGHPGDNTFVLRARFQQDAVDPQLWPDGVTAVADIVVIQENTNDFQVPLSFTRDNFNFMIDTAQAAGMRVVVQTMIPTAQPLGSYDFGSYIGDFNGNFLPQLAQQKGIVVANTYSAIVQPDCQMTSTSECFAVPGLLVDGFHPNKDGLILIYPTVSEALIKAAQ